jgi:hypothetical protein
LAPIRSDYSATAVTNIALLEADVGVLYHSISHPAIAEIELALSQLVCVGHPSVLPAEPAIDLNSLEGREIIGPDAERKICPGRAFCRNLPRDSAITQVKADGTAPQNLSCLLDVAL